MTKNYRVLDGCHNCAHMKDFTEHDTESLFVCLLQNPEMKHRKMIELYEFGTTVDAHATCDEWVKNE